MLALLITGWLAASASPCSGGPLPVIHRTGYVSADGRWAWTVDPDGRPSRTSRDPIGATCSVSRDGVETARVHLDLVPEEVVVSDLGWAVGLSEGPGPVPGQDLVRVVRLEPDGRHATLFEWRGRGRSVPCSRLPGVRARELRLDPAGNRVSLELLRVDEAWQAWGLDAANPSAPWLERLEGRDASYPEGPRVRSPEVAEPVPVELVPGGIVRLDALLERTDGLRSIDDPVLLPSGRLAFRDRKLDRGAVLDPNGGSPVLLGPLVDAVGEPRHLMRIIEGPGGQPWVEASGHRAADVLRLTTEGPLQGLPHPGLAELDYLPGFVLRPDGGIWVDGYGFVRSLDPRGRELARLDRHADGTWIERASLAGAPDGSLAVIDDRRKPSPRLPGVISVYGPDGKPRWSRHHLQGALGPVASTGELVGAACEAGVLLAAETGPLSCFEPPVGGAFAGFTPDGTRLAIVMQDPPEVRFYDLP